MKNLKLSYCQQKTINISDKGKLILDNWNDGGNTTTNNIVYLYTNDGIAKYDFNGDSLELLYGLMETVGCEYLAIKNELCAASKYGEVVLINPATKASEEVTFCAGGIKTMSWSPDQEIVVFITESNNVVVMTYTFDVISETSLDDQEFGDQKFITVGWGKKETQFHGSEGKQAAKQNVNFIAPENIDKLDKTITITWRGDSELFAVSFVGNVGRIFKVFNKEGRLQFTSEKLNDLGAAIAWKPSGSWIAVPHNLPNKYTIALFEKNGLRHRELVLPFKQADETIINLSWSTDSDILCVETTSTGNKSNLYLYTICNYHWYLKQTLQFGEKISNCLWDLGLNEGKTLHVLLENGSYIKYKWIFTIDSNEAIVAVIDGRNLLITDFQNAIIPPPMSNYVLEAPAYINSCGFLRNQQNLKKDINQLFIVTVDNFIRFYDFEYEVMINSREKLKSMNLLRKIEITLQEIEVPLYRNHWIWLNDERIIYCEYQLEFCILRLAQFSNNILINTNEIRKNEIIINVTNINENQIFYQSLNANIFSLRLLDNGNQIEFPLLPYCSLNENAENLKAIDLNGTIKIISLQTNRNLYVDSIKIASDVTSFYLTTKYLIFTQLSTIQFMLLSNNSIIDERKMERGGKIIAIVQKTANVVLQMPRGNLETINPRVLILDIIADILNASEYGKAMDILRKQRINLNIIIDHNPKMFLQQIDVFLEKVSNPQWLNLFLSDLENEDFTKTMYSSNYEMNSNNSNYPDGYLIEEKIQFICKKLCKHMETKDFHKFLLPIITTYVKRNNIEKALEIIWNEKKKENQEIALNDKKSSTTTSEDALKYLLYLVDVNTLYDVALGIYDFGLVLFVASKSQKDPKEYLPFLNQLKNFEENYRRFKIDEHLKRYENALEHICKCGRDRFDECLEFIQKHGLYQKALAIFDEGNSEEYKKIALLFGDYLRSHGKHEDASIMYERGDDLKQAILSAKHVLDWERCLMLTNILTNNDSKELKDISLSLVTALQEKGKYEIAWFLVKTYVGDFERALGCLLDGRYYLKAIFEAKMENLNLIETIVKPHLKNYVGILLTNLNSDMELFLKYKNRLQIIRKERAQRDIDGLYEDGIDECDILSDTSSMKSSNYTSSSRGTGKTFRSSKNRRKHERKLLSLKEGNPFEDIALIDALYNLVIKIVDQQQHIRETCKALMEICSDKNGKAIQKAFAYLLRIIKDSMDEIWIPEIATQQQQLVGPNIDYTQLQNEQRYAMINPQKRYKPQLNLIDWEHEILR